MSNLHSIDLTNGWEVPAAGCWRRRFGRPTGLGPADRTWLVIESAAGESAGHDREDVMVNGVAIPTLSGAGVRRADISALLQPRNELVLDMQAAASLPGADSRSASRRKPPPCVRRVRLEIDATE